MSRRWLHAMVPVAVLAGAGVLVAQDAKPPVSVETLTRQLWPAQRIEAALKDLEKQKADGLVTPKMYDRKWKMLEGRRAGTYKGQTLAATNPPPNLVQNGSFEDFNPNTRANMSRWDWWGGWAWPENAAYQNDKEDRPAYVRAGKLSARFTCTGAPARTGIATPKVPVVPGATGYELTIWARGEGDNRLNISFESGAAGDFNETIGAEWRKVTVVGKADAGAKEFMIWIYARGGGSIWLDDATLVPLGAKLED